MALAYVELGGPNTELPNEIHKWLTDIQIDMEDKVFRRVGANLRCDIYTRLPMGPLNWTVGL